MPVSPTVSFDPNIPFWGQRAREVYCLTHLGGVWLGGMKCACRAPSAPEGLPDPDSVSSDPRLGTCCSALCPCDRTPLSTQRC